MYVHVLRIRMPKKTLYVRESDLPIWDRAEKLFGEKSMSTVVTEALREKLGRPIDGFLNVLYANPTVGGPGGLQRIRSFAVMFAPLDKVGAMKPHYCQGSEALKDFLRDLGLTAFAVAQMFEELQRQYSSSVRIALSPDKLKLGGWLETSRFEGILHGRGGKATCILEGTLDQPTTWRIVSVSESIPAGEYELFAGRYFMQVRHDANGWQLMS